MFYPNSKIIYGYGETPRGRSNLRSGRYKVLGGEDGRLADELPVRQRQNRMRRDNDSPLQRQKLHCTGSDGEPDQKQAGASGKGQL